MQSSLGLIRPDPDFCKDPYQIVLTDKYCLFLIKTIALLVEKLENMLKIAHKLVVLKKVRKSNPEFISFFRLAYKHFGVCSGPI